MDSDNLFIGQDLNQTFDCANIKTASFDNIGVKVEKIQRQVPISELLFSGDMNLVDGFDIASYLVMSADETTNILQNYEKLITFVNQELMIVQKKNFDPLKMQTFENLRNTLLLKKKELVTRMIGKLESIVWQITDQQCSSVGATGIRGLVESCMTCYDVCCSFTCNQNFSRMNEALDQMMHKFITNVFQESFSIFLREENWINVDIFPKFWEYNDVIAEFEEFTKILENFMNYTSVRKKIETSSRRTRIDQLSNLRHSSIVKESVIDKARQILLDQSKKLESQNSNDNPNLKFTIGNRDLKNIQDLMLKITIDKSGFIIQKIGIKFLKLCVYFPQYTEQIKENYELLYFIHTFILLCRTLNPVILIFLSMINFDTEHIECDEQFKDIENIHDIILYQMGYQNIKKLFLILDDRLRKVDESSIVKLKAIIYKLLYAKDKEKGNKESPSKDNSNLNQTNLSNSTRDIDSKMSKKSDGSQNKPDEEVPVKVKKEKNIVKNQFGKKDKDTDKEKLFKKKNKDVTEKVEKKKTNSKTLENNFATLKAIKNLHALSIFEINNSTKYIPEIEKLLNYCLLQEKVKTTDIFIKIPKRNWLLEDDPEPTFQSDYIIEIKNFFNSLSTEIDETSMGLKFTLQFGLNQKNYLIEFLMKMLMESYSQVLKCSPSGKMAMMQDTLELLKFFKESTNHILDEINLYCLDFLDSLMKDKSDALMFIKDNIERFPLRILKGSYLYHHVQVSNKAVGFSKNIVVKKEDLITQLFLTKNFITPFLEKHRFLGTSKNVDYELLTQYLIDEKHEENKLKKQLKLVSQIDIDKIINAKKKANAK